MQILLDKDALNEVKQALSGLSKNIPNIQSRALNKTMIGVRTDKSAAIRSHLNLKKTYVDKHITVKKSFPSNVQGSVNTKSKRPGLMMFGGTKALKKGGVSVKVLTSGATVTLKHAFVADSKGATHVFQREYTGKAKMFKPNFAYAKLPKKYRYPIYRLAGPSLAEHIGQKKVIAEISILAGERLIKNANSQVEYELSKM